MDRKACRMATVFDLVLLKPGTPVEFIKRNRKGVVRIAGTGTVYVNHSVMLWVRRDEPNEVAIEISAKNVYQGKDSLKIIDNQEEEKQC